ILDNTRSLAVALEMDRNEYLPGEVATVKIIVTNRNDKAIEVLKPFDFRSASLEMLRYTEAAGFRGYVPCFTVPDRHLTIGLNAYGEVVWMSPFESQDTTVSTLDRSPAWRDFSRSWGSVPRTAGEYAAEYNLVPGAMVKFRVEPVVVEQIAHSRLPSVFFGE